jgi:hypothetical protein
VKITRREFTRQVGGLGASGMVAAAGYKWAEGGEGAPKMHGEVSGQTLGPTQRRPLGKTGLMLSPVGFGAQCTRDADLIRYALDLKVMGSIAQQGELGGWSWCHTHKG